LGLGAGVVLGGLLISLTGLYRALFVIDGLTFLVFFAIIYGAIAETRPPNNPQTPFWQGWGQAFRDRNLMIFALVNVLLTGYLAQVQSTLPVYLNRFATTEAGHGMAEGALSLLFTGHIILATLCQLPMARWLGRFRQAQGLMVSAWLWGIGFGLTWLAGTGMAPYLGAGLALAVMALAMVAYTPIGSALVAAIAPDALRGVYLSVNSMCWAMGYLIGPPLGGWALDQGDRLAHGFWLLLALSILPALGILAWLDNRLPNP
ncbi:MAG TPA: MFS transporter, partial [Leptolyngbyaceae cyanobacterium M65_K2018_010]|nr:MFS transporter [Leptolyngbyaceae cyanobacterium M65_K2018_010]